ncbi:MAG: lytic transglycosylase domain-containing protein [Sphingosinicella sp.]|nr:lytic transglycosylase domain-containing protein [Sphingosinicella sp.]
MIKLRSLLLAATFALPAIPTTGALAAPPAQLSATERNQYREVFAAIRAGDWTNANARLDGMREGPLHAAARAEIILAKDSPRAELPQILPLISAAPEMPKAAQLGRLAETRGAEEIPPILPTQNLVWAGSQPRRGRPKAVKGDPIADTLELQIQPLIVADQPPAAEALLRDNELLLSPEALSAFQQRIAWSYYLTGNNQAARELALKTARQGVGEWTVHSEWVAGLAAWRSGDCNGAADSFARVASRSGDVELTAAGHYWAARADMKCKRPERVQAHLRGGAQHKETFYGILSGTALGIQTRNFSELHDYGDAEWRGVATKPNVRAAIALTEIGEAALADEFIRHQAKLGGAADHAALLHLADDLNLASTQYWLAHNAPRGTSVNPAARYPMPDWRPTGGWRVDPSWVFAHALQESNFRTQVVSPANAMGVMQVRPGTAGDIARSRGQAFDQSQLLDPNVNIEYGQSYIEYLRTNSGTGGLLPKVIAAYNAGPAPISAWNGRQLDGGDPLLYIESIPYWETRGYVPIVLRNYWIYEQKAGKASASRTALAQGMWPRAPGMPGPTAVRIEPRPAFGTTNAGGVN